MHFKDSASLIGKKLIFFHDYIMIVVVLVSILVLFLLILIYHNKNYFKYLSHGMLIEIIWTTVPAIILILIAVPSLYLLYNMDNVVDIQRTMKCLGHQWYWKFEEMEDYDSYMVNSKDLKIGEHRLLNVDNNIIGELNQPTRLIVSGNDVIHCFTLPSLGLKVDGVPGKLNQTMFNINRPGEYYGQCSEICGAEHSFMPVKLTTK